MSIGRDLLSDDSNQIPQGRDLLSNQSEPTESFVHSLGYAIPRVLEDLAKSGYGFLQKIPSYYESAKTEIPGLLETTYKHPQHLLMQGLAGSQELINNLAQTPLNLARYGQERLHLVPGAVTQALHNITPQDTSQTIHDMFGEPQYPGEALARGIVRDIPQIAVGGELSSSGKNLIPSYVNGIQAGKNAEKFRSQFGNGTSLQNAIELSRRTKFAKESTKNEALIPKNELYNQFGSNEVYQIPTDKLPEGNLDKFSNMFENNKNYNFSKGINLSKALQDYRKGKVDKLFGGTPLESFTNRAEDIFNIPELSEKDYNRVEDVLNMPTSRKSYYFSDKNVTDPYSTSGKLINLHDNYKKDSTLDNYQDLRSAITTQLRQLKERAKTNEVSAEKYEMMKNNLSNLDKDARNFTKTLPENVQELDKDFRKKYSSYATTYEKGDKETGPSLTLRRLASGRHSLVSDNDIVQLFSHPTESDKKALLDMGSSASRNAIYAALQKVKPNDAAGMANTLIDLKKTKGFDNIITPDIEKWANDQLRNIKNVKSINNYTTALTGATVGGLLGGPVGTAIGLTAPLIKKIGLNLIKNKK